MMSQSEIEEKLRHIGFKETELASVMRDVAQVIYGRALAAYLPHLSEEERARIASLQPEEFEAYFDEHASSLPYFSQEEFDTIHDDTWREYFLAVG